MTTILNASVMPVVSTYVERLGQRLAERGIAAPLMLMKSSGGVTSTRTVRRALRPRGRRRRRGLRRCQLRPSGPDRDRHRRYLRRHYPDTRGRARPHHPRPHWTLARRPAHSRHRHHRRYLGHRGADGGAAKRWRPARSRLLPTRGSRADRDGCPSRAWPFAALSPR